MMCEDTCMPVVAFKDISGALHCTEKQCVAANSSIRQHRLKQRAFNAIYRIFKDHRWSMTSQAIEILSEKAEEVYKAFEEIYGQTKE